MIKCHEFWDCRRYAALQPPCGCQWPYWPYCSSMSCRGSDTRIQGRRPASALSWGCSAPGLKAWSFKVTPLERPVSKKSAQTISCKLFRIRNPRSCEALFPIKSHHNHHTGCILLALLMFVVYIHPWPSQLAQKLLNCWHKGHICGVGQLQHEHPVEALNAWSSCRRPKCIPGWNNPETIQKCRTIKP